MNSCVVDFSLALGLEKPFEIIHCFCGRMCWSLLFELSQNIVPSEGIHGFSQLLHYR